MLSRLLPAFLFVPVAVAQMPPVPVPAQNPITPAKVALGKILFWDEQLSSDDSIACGTCHVPEFGGGEPRFQAGLNPGPDELLGTDDDIHGSPGITRQNAAGDFTPAARFGLRRQVTGRVANTNLGAAYHNDLFWDGRALTQFTDPETNQVLIPYNGALESQALGPILSPVEMGREGRSWQDVRQKLQSATPLALALSTTPDLQAALQQNPTYPALFTAAFGDPAITAARIAFALATYQRTLIPNDTPWDRFFGGQPSALSPSQQAGWALFTGNGRCNACHLDPLFTDDQFHNLGLRPAGEDRGFGVTTGLAFDDGAFKTPTLRNAGLRPRLFHNGQSPALDDPSQATDQKSTLQVYFKGGGADRSNLDPFLLPLQQLGVTVQDLLLIQDFVRTGLTDQRAALGLPPFDHPQLRSLQFAPPRVFGQGLAGSGEPFFVDTVPTYPGNQDWKLGLVAGSGQTLAYVGYGNASIEPGIVLGLLPWNVQVADGRLFLLSGNAGEPGHATWRLPIPPDPLLQQYPLYFQLWALDPAAPLGIATSPGIEFLVR